MQLYRHVDGGVYSLQGDQDGKDPQTGEWIAGVRYRGMDGKDRWTEKARWEDRFTPLTSREVAQERVHFTDDEGETVVDFMYRIDEVSDVRHMIISAANAASRGRSHYVELVLKAQAEMISKNLHLRDHDFPDLLGDVNAFHAKFGLEYTGKPRMLPQDLHEFRCEFHREETEEYRDERIELEDAVRRQDRRDILTSLEKQLDGLADSVWVLLGTADLQFGRKAFFEAWKRVAKANMAKVRKELAVEGQHEDSGRAPKFDVVKPAGWQAPDHRDLVEDNEIFDELFGEAPVEAEPEYIPTAQEPGYSDTRSV
jgi:predicted HAD superfamily Cof-like phosphohydrolase